MEFYVKIDGALYEATGEIVMISEPMTREEALERMTGPAPRGPFDIHRKAVLVKFLGTLGQRGRIAAYLLNHADGSGRLFATNRQLAKATGTSLAAVSAFLGDLREAGMIRTRTGGLMLNPGISHRGDRRREALLMESFRTFGEGPQ